MYKVVLRYKKDNTDNVTYSVCTKVFSDIYVYPKHYHYQFCSSEKMRMHRGIMKFQQKFSTYKRSQNKRESNKIISLLKISNFFDKRNNTYNFLKVQIYIILSLYIRQNGHNHKIFQISTIYSLTVT